MNFTADTLYGPTGRIQPDPVAAQATGAGQLPPDPNRAGVRTTRHVAGPLGNPTLAIVAIIALALLIANVSVSGSFSVRG